MPAETRDLTGTVVAVTGASAGIGEATVRLLVEAGAKVAAGARRVERLEGLVEELGADNVLPVEMDVRRPPDNDALIQGAIAKFGRLDSVVANAGLGSYGGLMDHTDEAITEMVETNYLGTIWTARAAVPSMLKAGGGDIVIVSSVAGLRGLGIEAVYAGTKHAQMGLAGGMDRELSEKGIRVSAICPAAVDTEFAIGTGRTEGDAWLDAVLRADDVAFSIVTTLQQPRRLRTTIWSMWSMSQQS
ncbi:MAG: family mycofactocin-dependent oxidoreductase [Aeromicrobium sp.]|nr:family mycofactocin-dependent oxidoreductase [Aeromicrobium sp.]